MWVVAVIVAAIIIVVILTVQIDVISVVGAVAEVISIM
jgi:hypothetical protein